MGQPVVADPANIAIGSWWFRVKHCANLYLRRGANTIKKNVVFRKEKNK